VSGSWGAHAVRTASAPVIWLSPDKILDRRRNLLRTSAHIGKSLASSLSACRIFAAISVASGLMVAHVLLRAVLGVLFFAAAARRDSVILGIRQAPRPGGFRVGATRGAIARLTRRQGLLTNALAANDLGVCGNAPSTAPRTYIVAGVCSHVPSYEAGDPHAGLLSKLALQYSLASRTSQEIAYESPQWCGYVVIASVLALSALCDRTEADGRDEPLRPASDNR